MRNPCLWFIFTTDISALAIVCKYVFPLLKNKTNKKKKKRQSICVCCIRRIEEAKNVLEAKYEVIGGILSPVHDEYGKMYKDSLKEANGKQRVEMCRLATQTSDWIGVSDWEALVRTEWTRVAVVMNTFFQAINGETARTILDKKDSKAEPLLLHAHDRDNDKESKSVTDSESTEKKHITLKFLCGGDLLDSFLVPNLWLNEHVCLFGFIYLLRLRVKIILGYGIACIERENTNEREVIRKHEVLSTYAQNIDLIKLSVHNTVSSSIVRKLQKERKSIKYLTEDLVIDFVEKNNLYREEQKNT
ncbi:nicotinamide mononucleotide adenylyltransferase 1 [Reticulomyxa filosa]|uniref:Nicotinamide mononucleotide adenylyltransferase 1 n=1 Tax=Reticulomyxa filosa TaxID=46433 RepID=X6MDH4_RETFI|nr:nicotinamide mononucleotide adenylyltransferase 1 [Reticulomyxa filosa]|eukprot:ETO11914.1 nicotinamide mononucleotide adenylyltransferase 1 [Reticulomyxa filosa]